MLKYSEHAGEEERPLVCQVCGDTVFLKDAIRVSDRYSVHYGRTVCTKHYMPLNPQQYPQKIVERNLVDPKFVNPPKPTILIERLNADVLPSVPQNLNVTYDFYNEILVLYWDAPLIQGAGVTGYRVTRSNPQGSFQFVLIENTGNSLTWFKDETANPDEFYAYQVIAINTVGESAPSDFGYWPYDNISNEVDVYLVTEDGNTLITEAGDYLLLE